MWMNLAIGIAILLQLGLDIIIVLSLRYLTVVAVQHNRVNESQQQINSLLMKVNNDHQESLNVLAQAQASPKRVVGRKLVGG